MLRIVFCLTKHFKMNFMSEKKVREKFRECLNHKKGNKKVQRVPQSQTTARPRYQKEEGNDNTKQAQIERMHEKH